MRRGAINTIIAAACAGLAVCGLAALAAPHAPVAAPPTHAVGLQAPTPPAAAQRSATAASPAVAAARPVAARDTGSVIVSLKHDLSASRRRAIGLGDATPLHGQRLYVCPAPAGETAADFATRLRRSGAVETAGPDRLLVPAYTATPNDPYFTDPSTFSLPNSMGTVSTIAHAKSWALRGSGSANFDRAWPALANQKAGPQAVRVAVIDTGFYFDSRLDLQQSNITAAVDECATYTPIPVAGSQLTTDADVTPVSVDPTDAAHGTMVASEIGAGTNNGGGAAGAAWDTRVDVYKVQGIAGADAPNMHKGDAVIPESAIVNAINDAVSDADRNHYRLIISLSLVVQSGTPGISPLQATITRALGHSAIVVAAAGNGINGVALPTVSEPAAYPGVIAVGAARFGGAVPVRSRFSNYGSGLDILAPGEVIWGPTRPGTIVDSGHPEDGCYTWWTGTSMATPYVASAAALLLRVEPSLSATEVEGYLERSALDLGAAGRDSQNGWGFLDAGAAYRLLATPVTTTDAKPRYANTATIHFIVADRDGTAGETTHYELDDWGPAIGTSVSTADYEDQFHTHTLRYWSVDANGVTEATRTLTFILSSPDTTAPVTTSDVKKSNAGRAVIKLSPSDSGPEDWGLAGTRYLLDSGGETSGTALTVGSTGVHTLVYWSTDLAGNVEAARTDTFTVTPLATKATITRNVTSVRHGSHVHLTGKLTPARAGDTVTVWIRYPGARSYTKAYKRTISSVNSAGVGSWAGLTYTLARRGRYYFRVVFSGDSTNLSRKAYTSAGVSVYSR